MGVCLRYHQHITEVPRIPWRPWSGSLVWSLSSYSFKQCHQGNSYKPAIRAVVFDLNRTMDKQQLICAKSDVPYIINSRR
jgi:hypothetical protein